MRRNIYILIFFLLFGTITSVKSQENGLREKVITQVLAPYRGGLYSYLESEKNNETKAREDFKKLFSNDTIIIYNDIPGGSDFGKYLTIKQYTQLVKPKATNNTKLEIEFDYDNLLLCLKTDTLVYLQKNFVINQNKSSELLRFKIKYFPDVEEDPLKIVSIDKVSLPSDKDGDKVPDECDVCADIKGSLNYFGCIKKEEKDSDNDGVNDDEDKCPLEHGLKIFSGCPDSDGDDVPNNVDNCPNEFGKKDLMGCPDKDNDGVPDKDDFCPDEPGLPTNGGCPVNKVEKIIDSDSDGIPDKYDNCKYEKGTKELSGCPDSDLDGIPDNKDECPNEFGLYYCKGCPDRDYDGIADYQDNCPDVAGMPYLDGCPYPQQPAQYSSSKDSDGDGIVDSEDSCPHEYGRTSNGCPHSSFDYFYNIEPVRDKPVKFGIGISCGFVTSSLKNADNDIDNDGGLGFSPYIFTTIRLTDKSRLQFDFCYSKRSFVFSNHGDDSEYGNSDVYYYNTTNAQMAFIDLRAYTKLNINSFYFGGYFAKTINAARSGNIEYFSAQNNVYYKNYKYDFLDKIEYPIVSGEKPISDYTYGLTIGYEKIFRNGWLLGLGFDYSPSNYFNKKYSKGWDLYGDNLDLYPSKEIDLKLHYLFLNLGYRFGNID